MSQPQTVRGGLLGPVLQEYFCEYLINQRRLSPRTVEAYRDTFKLLLGFLERDRGLKPDELRVADVDADSLLAFLDDLERTRRNCARSRNARLAAIRSFYRFALARDPLLLAVAQRVLAVPSKRFERRVVGFLSKAEVQELIDAPDLSTWTGLRDRLLLTLLYNTGARVSEVAALRVSDVLLAGTGALHLCGKGRKDRNVPLWRDSVRLLRRWLSLTGARPEAPLLPNARGGRMTRSGIEHRLKVAHRIATARSSSMKGIKLSPHVIRHTTAMHLLQSGVDLSVIAMWLGHESIETTHRYLDADIERKKRALERLPPPTTKTPRRGREQNLIAFLRRL